MTKTQGIGKAKNCCEVLARVVGIERPEVGDLRLAEHLDALRGKARDEAGEREPGARHVRAA